MKYHAVFTAAHSSENIESMLSCFIIISLWITHKLKSFSGSGRDSSLPLMACRCLPKNRSVVSFEAATDIVPQSFQDTVLHA